MARAGQRLGCTEALFTLGERPEGRYPEAKEWLAHRGYRTTLEYLTAMCKMVVEETSLLPHANPGTMSRQEMTALRPYNPSMGLMLESTSRRLYEEGGPHEFAPSKRPRVRLRTSCGYCRAKWVEIAPPAECPRRCVDGIFSTVRRRCKSPLKSLIVHLPAGLSDSPCARRSQVRT